MADDGRAGVRPSEDTLDSAFSYMAKGGDTVAMEAPAHQRRKAEERRWLVFSVAGGSLVLVGLAVLLFLLFKGPAEKKPLENEDDPPVVENPVVPITPVKKPPEKANDGWVKEVGSLPAEKQVKTVAARLKELNPGFDGKVTHKIENGVVTELKFLTDNVTDISPLVVLNGLKSLSCNGSAHGKGKLFDLAPLKGMKLIALDCFYTQVADLSPLKRMSLTHLNCGSTQVADLSPLKGMPLTDLGCNITQVADLLPLKNMKLAILNCGGTRVVDLSPLKRMPLTSLECAATAVADLSPLKGMPLTVLTCHATPLSDLSPLKGMKLTYLQCYETKVSDLSPLKGMPLTFLNCSTTQVADLSPLKSMPLKELWCDFKPERDAKILRSIKALLRINGKPAKEFWKEVGAQQKAFEGWLKEVKKRLVAPFGGNKNKRPSATSASVQGAVVPDASGPNVEAAWLTRRTVRKLRTPIPGCF